MPSPLPELEISFLRLIIHAWALGRKVRREIMTVITTWSGPIPGRVLYATEVLKVQKLLIPALANHDWLRVLHIGVAMVN